MKIKSGVYESLAPRQRLLATVEALARQDNSEIKKLISFCPKKIYSMNDAGFTDGIETILDLSTILYLMMLYETLTALGVQLILDEDDYTPPMPFLRRALAIQMAWHDFLIELGISPAVVDKATVFPHPILEYLFELCARMQIEPDYKYKNEIQSAIEVYFKRSVSWY